MAEHTLFPSILPTADEPFVDDSYSKEELERKDWQELRQIAAKHPIEEINGQSEQAVIVETLTGEERV